MKRIVNTSPYLILELIVLMVGVPLLLSTVIPLKYMLVSLWLVALYCHIIYRAIVDLPERIYWRWREVNWPNLRPVLLRFIVSTMLALVITALWKPTFLFSFVCERTQFWAFVMVAYPIISVIPQEIVFRSFFFQRYARVFPNTLAMIIASGIMFGAAHLIFQNWVAPLLCVIGGIFFAQTYAKTRSLALAVIEHALYGCMIFTVGLGIYFYHGVVHSKFEAKQPIPACAYISQTVEKVRATIF